MNDRCQIHPEVALRPSPPWGEEPCIACHLMHQRAALEAELGALRSAVERTASAARAWLRFILEHERRP